MSSGFKRAASFVALFTVLTLIKERKKQIVDIMTLEKPSFELKLGQNEHCQTKLACIKF